MDNEFKLEQLISQLGQVNDRIERLENVDYMTAMYKGYSAAGETVEEILDDIESLRDQADHLTVQLEALGERLD
ncbi:hypothetical protein [Secundilactobacillus similis]|jgi:prefoldin subunit 5|uniref:Uncharacterized protein n=1 Tax=Secundilactobacillus similis DSM 23365 = JCM 2765 TaxID=1423804 RepID=A0A0R2F1C8_9LACO|nr:hypothetical protein [Secundilactobacillus similis]KRN18237.1 hypothetical protein FD14_GL002101 [Secundilactobacillus similis DSM 23365 = JCM 2765]